MFSFFLISSESFKFFTLCTLRFYSFQIQTGHIAQTTHSTQIIPFIQIFQVIQATHITQINHDIIYIKEGYDEIGTGVVFL